MFFIYGQAEENKDNALSLIRSLRKRDPHVCLLAKLSDDEEGLKVIDILVKEMILFDPDCIGSSNDNLALTGDELFSVLNVYSDVKAIFISKECDETMITNLVNAVSKLKERPIIVSEKNTYQNADCKICFENGETKVEGKTLLNCHNIEDVLIMLMQNQCFGSVLEKPSLNLSCL